MPTVKHVALPFPFTATIRLRGGREQSRPVYGWTTAPVPVVDAGEAPVVLRARGVRVSRRVDGHDLTWRAWRGLHWRPVLDDHGAPQLVDAEELFEEPPMSPRTRRWLDHPCGMRLGCRFVEGPSAKGWWPGEGAEFLPRSDRIVGGNRPEAAAAVVAIASDEMAEIDGVLHKRAALPMWSLGQGIDPSGYDGSIGLVVPDFGGGAQPSLGLVPVTHPDVARELARRIARDARGEPAPDLPAVDGAIEILGDIPVGDGACRTLLHAMAMLGDAMLAAGYFPEPRVRKALIEMAITVGEMEAIANAGGHHLVARGLAYVDVEAACEALGEAVPPRPGLAALLRTALDCGLLCRDPAARSLEDDEEDDVPSPGF